MQINPAQLGAVKPLRPGPMTAEDRLQSARDLKKAYTDFVGKTFFGQMIKSMRSTVDKPAYFNGGKAEEMFQSQLDQQTADAMSNASAEQITEPMFNRQFPQQSKLLAEANAADKGSLTDLAGLRRY
jgi:Rod binding domain-containing protein